ncbi:MAG TPA: hypothetical protein VJ821_14385 [Anaerolineales bacterium]|nr:hypothetical protein [Anaerolineales bacterium]
MKNLIGGLFETQENANLAYEALQRSGFAEDDIRMFIHKPRNKVIRSTQVSVQDVARNVILGALILGLVGALIGFLVGNGTISLPYLEPGSAPREPLFVFMSVLWGLITGGLTGAILGAASRLLRSREKAELMTREIDKRGVIVTVHADGMKSEGTVRRIMEEHHAVKIGDPHEQWDMKDWVSPNENQPSLANTR